LSPSAYGGLSIRKLKVTRGNLWFSTIRTLSPFGNENVSGLPTFIVGAAPCFGCGIICACISVDKNKLDMTINIFFMMA
jgi:hypothetical protein